MIYGYTPKSQCFLYKNRSAVSLILVFIVSLDLTGHSLRAKSGLSAEMGTKPQHPNTRQNPPMRFCLVFGCDKQSASDLFRGYAPYPIKFTQRPSLFARYALQNREEHFANFGRAHASARLELRLT